MRIFIAVMFAGLGLAGAVAVYEILAERECVVRAGLERTCAGEVVDREPWVLPIAIMVGVTGVAAAAAVARRGV